MEGGQTILHLLLWTHSHPHPPNWHHSHHHTSALNSYSIFKPTMSQTSVTVRWISLLFIVKTPPHFEQFRTVFLSQFAVEHCDGSLQVSPLLCYLLLSFLQLLQLFLPLPPQSLQVLELLLIQEAMEVLKLGSDFSLQDIKTALKDEEGKRWAVINSALVWLKNQRVERTTWSCSKLAPAELIWMYSHLFCVKVELLHMRRVYFWKRWGLIMQQYLYFHWLYVRLSLCFSALIYLVLDSFNSLDKLFL